MNIKLRTDKPDDIVYSITLTATAKEFRQFKAQLVETWPSSQLSMHITDILIQADSAFYPKGE